MPPATESDQMPSVKLLKLVRTKLSALTFSDPNPLVAVAIVML